MYLVLTDVIWIVVGITAVVASLTAISFAIVIYARKHPEGKLSASDNLIIYTNIMNRP